MIEVKMHFARETKRTLRYESNDENAPITVLYIQKSGLPGQIENITVNVKEA